MCETKIILMALMAKGIIDYSIVVYCSFIVNINTNITVIFINIISTFEHIYQSTVSETALAYLL